MALKAMRYGRGVMSAGFARKSMSLAGYQAL